MTWKEIHDLLEDAEANAETDWEIDFVADQQARFEKWGERIIFSASQGDQLRRLATKGQ